MKTSTLRILLAATLFGLVGCRGTRLLIVQSSTAGKAASGVLTNIHYLAIYVDGPEHRADLVASTIRIKAGSSIRLSADAKDSEGQLLVANPEWRPQHLDKLRVSPNIGPNVVLTALEASDSTFVEVMQAGVYARFTVIISE